MHILAAKQIHVIEN